MRAARPRSQAAERGVRCKIEPQWSDITGVPAGLAGGANRHHCSGRRFECEPETSDDPNQQPFLRRDGAADERRGRRRLGRAARIRYHVPQPGRPHLARPRRGQARGIRGGQGDGAARARGERGLEGRPLRAGCKPMLGPGGNPSPLASPSFFFGGGASARFLSFPIVLAISAPNRRHGARLRQHGRSPDTLLDTLVPDTLGGMLRVRMGRTDWAAVLFKRICTMATTVKQMKAAARSRAGKGAARAERRAGRVPGVIYGDGKPPLNVSVDHADLKQRIYAGRFLTTIYELDVDGTKVLVTPRDFQLDPVKDLPVHVDFLRLGEGAQIRVRIPVHVINGDQSPGVKRGGTVNTVTHSVEVICSPEDIPESIDVDVSGL